MQQCQILILGEAGGSTQNFRYLSDLMPACAGVGTRALCCRFASDFFPEDYDPVIEGTCLFRSSIHLASDNSLDLYEKHVAVDGEKINIQLYDVAGQEEYL